MNGERPGIARAVDAEPADAEPAAEAVGESRRQLTRDGLAIAAYALPVGLVYGLAALQAHFTLLDVVAASVVVLAGGSQFAAAGMVKAGTPVAVLEAK